MGSDDLQQIAGRMFLIQHYLPELHRSITEGSSNGHMPFSFFNLTHSGEKNKRMQQFFADDILLIEP